MRKSKVLSFVLVAALAVTAIPINAFGTVNDEKNKLSDLQNQKQQAQDENNNYRNLSLMHRSTFSQLIRS